jgi:hypothetical protein
MNAMNPFRTAAVEAAAALTDAIHSCSYFCDRPGCIKAQRDELRAAVEAAAPPGHEFMQDLDSMLYAAYVDGREDEREDIRREVLERAEAVPIKDRVPYLDLLLRLTRPLAIPATLLAASGSPHSEETK